MSLRSSSVLSKVDFIGCYGDSWNLPPISQTELPSIQEYSVSGYDFVSSSRAVVLSTSVASVELPSPLHFSKCDIKIWISLSLYSTSD